MGDFLYSFFVLGHVPGTHIQITFRLWAIAAGVLACFWLLVHSVRKLRRGEHQPILPSEQIAEPTIDFSLRKLES